MASDSDDALICGATYILTGIGECYACEKKTRLFALMGLPPIAFESGEDNGLDDDGPMLNNIGDMPASVVGALMQTSAERWRKDFSRTADESYWMNHCEHCDAKQGDHFVQGPNGPFWPNTEAEMDEIVALRIEGPLRFSDASASYSGAMADWRDRRHGVVRPPPVVRKKRVNRI